MKIENLAETDFFIKRDVINSQGNTVSLYGETDLDRLEGLGRIAGKNLNELQRKANLVARQIAREGGVESGVFMYDTTRAKRGGLYMPFSLYMTDGNVLVGEVKNTDQKKWNKNKPMSVDYWLLNGKDITDKVDKENPLKSLLAILKTARPQKVDPKIKELEEKISDKLSTSLELTEEIKPLMVLIESKTPTQKELQAFNSLVDRIDESQNLISLKVLEKLNGAYESSLLNTAI